MQIAVDGIRTSVADWRAAQKLPAERLPSLSPAQRETALKLHISEEDYARSTFAAQGTHEKLLQKTERFARWLQSALQRKAADTEIKTVILNTWDGKFEVVAGRNGAPLFFKVDEDIVDALFESGSPEAEQRLGRVLDLVLNDGAVAA